MTDLKKEIEEKLRKEQLLFYPIGDETIDKWLEEANKKIIRGYEQALSSQKQEFEKIINELPIDVQKDYKTKKIRILIDKKELKSKLEMK